MKRMITTFALLCIIAIATNAQTLQSIFDKYAEDERFEYVSVGKGMMNMANALGAMAGAGQAMPDMQNGSTKILTLKSDAESALSKSIEKELAKAISNGNYETVVETREKGEKVHIYSRNSGKDQTETVIISRERKELSIIWVVGKKAKKKSTEPVSELSDTTQSNG